MNALLQNYFYATTVYHDKLMNNFESKTRRMSLGKINNVRLLKIPKFQATLLGHEPIEALLSNT